MSQRDSGFSLVDLLVAIAVLGILASIGLVHAGQDRARAELDGAMRRLAVGLEQARRSAERDGKACALSLTEAGWQPPVSADLSPCRGAGLALEEPLSRGVVRLDTNLPDPLRFSVNGLVLDGGLAVLSAPGSTVRPCLVVSLPLGVMRQGRYQQDPAAGLSSSHCLPTGRTG